jgi:hypothetical protein
VKECTVSSFEEFTCLIDLPEPNTLTAAGELTSSTTDEVRAMTSYRDRRGDPSV